MARGPKRRAERTRFFCDSSGAVLFMILNVFQKKTEFPVGSLKVKSSATAAGDSSQCLGKCGGNDPCLPLSLDETNVPAVCAHSRGTYMLGKHRQAWRCAPRHTASKTEQRMSFALAALICNDRIILNQSRHMCFSQIKRLGNKNNLDVSVRDVTDESVRWTEKERSNSGKEHAITLKVLGVALRPYPDTMQPIVYFDSARIHPTDECLAGLARPSIRLVAIPPRRTWLRQPLDTHVFLRFQSTVVSSMSWETTGISPLL